MVSATIDAKRCLSREERAHSKKRRFRSAVCASASRSPRDDSAVEECCRGEQASGASGPFLSSLADHSPGTAACMTWAFNLEDLLNIRPICLSTPACNSRQKNSLLREIVLSIVPRPGLRRAGPAFLQIILAPPRRRILKPGGVEEEGARRARPPERTLART